MANHSSSNTASGFLQGHFMDMDQQLDTAKFGMWVFLVTEVLFFGGLFAAYIIYRILFPALFEMSAHHLDITLGTINTLVLISSSFTVAMAIRSAQTDRKKNISIYLIITIALAVVFLVIKYFEWTHKFHLGIFPGQFYTFEGIAHPKAHIFFSLYYLMTGLHAVHIIVGIGLMIWLLIGARKGNFSHNYYTPVEITGLYWHFVDIIWIFLFPLFYLIS